MKSLMKLKNIIICDFDETITNRDTISIVGEIPYRYKANLKPEWSHFAETYMQNYKKFRLNSGTFRHSQRSLPLLPSSRPRIDSSNYGKLFENELRYQNDARQLEMSSTDEMAKYKIFSNIKLSDVSLFAKEKLEGEGFSLREGFNNFALSIPKDDFYIVSVNWSREFIHASVGDDVVDPEHIYCNRLLSDKGVYIGKFSNCLLTGSDKVNVVEKILANRKTRDAKYWYVGDSETDLLTVLHPEVNGILLLDPEQDEPKFRKLTSDVLGLEQHQVDKFIGQKDCGWLQCYEKNEKTSVYLARSWFDLRNIYQEIESN